MVALIKVGEKCNTVLSVIKKSRPYFLPQNRTLLGVGKDFLESSRSNLLAHAVSASTGCSEPCSAGF